MKPLGLWLIVALLVAPVAGCGLTGPDDLDDDDPISDDGSSGNGNSPQPTTDQLVGTWTATSLGFTS